MSKFIRGFGPVHHMDSSETLAEKKGETLKENQYELTDITINSERVRRVVTAGILAALSIASTPVASMLPRLSWGIALFDPVSLFWIAAFLLAGPYVGLLTAGVGTLGLFFTDPTVVGPLFKLLATLPMMIVPIVAIRNMGTEKGMALARPRFYFILMLIAFVVRIAIMVPVNLALVPILMGVDDASFIIDYTILLNAVQSFWDATVPYVVIHKTSIFEHFRMW